MSKHSSPGKPSDKADILNAAKPLSNKAADSTGFIHSPQKSGIQTCYDSESSHEATQSISRPSKDPLVSQTEVGFDHSGELYSGEGMQIKSADDLNPKQAFMEDSICQKHAKRLRDQMVEKILDSVFGKADNSSKGKIFGKLWVEWISTMVSRKISDLANSFSDDQPPKGLSRLSIETLYKI